LPNRGDLVHQHKQPQPKKSDELPSNVSVLQHVVHLNPRDLDAANLVVVDILVVRKPKQLFQRAVLEDPFVFPEPQVKSAPGQSLVGEERTDQKHDRLENSADKFPRECKSRLAMHHQDSVHKDNENERKHSMDLDDSAISHAMYQEVCNQEEEFH
jgi:hypothetical protein